MHHLVLIVLLKLISEAEILALQVKIETASINNTTKKDASTQAHISFIKKNQSKFSIIVYYYVVECNNVDWFK